MVIGVKGASAGAATSTSWFPRALPSAGPGLAQGGVAYPSAARLLKLESAPVSKKPEVMLGGHPLDQTHPWGGQCRQHLTG